MSQAYSCRPSSLLGIQDDYLAWCMDQACFAWGSFVAGQLEVATIDPDRLNDPKVQQSIHRRRAAEQRLLYLPLRGLHQDGDAESIDADGEDDEGFGPPPPGMQFLKFDKSQFRDPMEVIEGR
jgi:hypothetical protein